MIYNTGTISVSGNTATGTGTNWTAAASQVRAGQTLIVLSNPVQMFQITAVNSATSLAVTPAASPALSGQKYGILISDTMSLDGLAQAMSQLINEYDENIGGWEAFAGTTANQNITVTINGVSMTIPALGKLAQKGANSDITELKGLTTALSVVQGGTGAKDAVGARSALGLGNAAVATVTASSADPTFGRVMTVADFGLGATAATALGSPDANGIAFTSMLVGAGASGPVYNFFDGSAPIFTMVSGSRRVQQQISSGGALAVRGSTNAGVSWSGWFRQWGEANTTVDSNGFIKRASPVVKLFADGRAETNEESEGVIVTRLSEGVYSIEGCMGMNADATWGGTDGGFEIPVDRNKQPLLWLDYKVCADGSIKVKTFHRTYPEAPDFARNTREGYADGDPIDIPADQFVSVRVEMPQNSIWNQNQEADRIAMEEAERLAAEQAETSGTGSDKN